jgi:flavodoxin
MKTLIIYNSFHHHNTQKVAEAMGDALKADVLKYDAVDPDRIPEYHLIGFGSGIYYGKPDKGLVQFIEGLPHMENKRAFVFITSGAQKQDYPRNLAQILEEKGFEIIGQFHTKAYDTWGPLKLVGGINKGRPNEDDLKKAQKFVLELKEKLIV